MTNPDEDTVEIEVDGAEDFAGKFFAPDQPRFEVHFGAASHVGKVRATNDDHFAIVQRTRSQEMLLSNLPSCPSKVADEAYAFIVADGMGGQAFGEFASRLVLQKIFELAARATSWLMKFTHPDMQQVHQRIDAYLQQLQETLSHHARLDPELRGMGTTCTSVYLMPPHALVAHIGDSRAYYFRDGRLEQITRDHTVAQRLIDAGVAPENTVRFRNLLTNVLGGADPEAIVEINPIHLEAGDRLLLCSDGLSGMVDDETIADVLSSETAPQAACDRLVQLALEAGGDDNVTVVVAELASITSIAQAIERPSA